MTRRTINMTPTLYQYYLDVSLREAEVLTQLREKTATLSSAKMQIAPEEGQFLAFLAKSINAQKTLDIGVYTGYSALVVALALPSKGRVVACDINIEWTTIAKQFWQSAEQAHKIDLRIAPAIDTLKYLLDQGEAKTFDFVFIDADKESYPEYYELSLALLRPGGLIAVDNVFQEGCVADLEDQRKNTVAIRAFNAKVYTDSRVDLTMIPIADGLTVVRKL